jgi:hypothetical protein
VRAVVETGGGVGRHPVEVRDVDSRLVPVDPRDPLLPSEAAVPQIEPVSRIIPIPLILRAFKA